MKRVACALVLAACSTEDNLGNHALFGKARWSIALGGAGDDQASALAVDTIGNVVVAGTCNGVIDFGSGPVWCSGSFISQRASETGAEQWTVQVPDARITSVAYLGDRIMVTGAMGTSTVDQFIATYDREGELQASVTLGLAGFLTAPLGMIASDGRVFSTGGLNTSTDTVMVPPSTLDGFLASHYADGTRAWTMAVGGEGRQLGTALAVNAHHDIALVVETWGPFVTDGHQIAVADYPAQLLLRWSPQAKLMWSHTLPAVPVQIALAANGDTLVGACPETFVLDSDGKERWRLPCENPHAHVDAATVTPDGVFVLGGHHDDAATKDGELVLVAFDESGDLVSAARTTPYSEPSDSRIDAIAVEPTGEVVFATTASHAFDFGNGSLPHAGEHDVVVAKLDSNTGRDGQVTLTRPAP